MIMLQEFDSKPRTHFFILQVLLAVFSKLHLAAYTCFWQRASHLYFP